MSRSLLPFLRPYLCRNFNPLPKPAHARVYSAIQRRCQHASTRSHTAPHDVEKQKRLDQLQSVNALGEYYPRGVPAGSDKVENISIRTFNGRYRELFENGKKEDDMKSDKEYGHKYHPGYTRQAVFGRIRSIRLLGSKLMFLDIERDNARLQAMVELKKLYNLERNDSDQQTRFKNFKKVARVGDWILIQGHPMKSDAGQLTIAALEIPVILAPSLHHVPDQVDNPETLARRPHLHQLTSREPGDVLKLRAQIIRLIRRYLEDENFLEVETPMLDAVGGGAIARPFETVANEMSNTPVKLRIAPELNLKRLIIGGQGKVFEIGRVFRNEGVDNTHNPEFSTCEFYEVGANLPALIKRTEDLVRQLFVRLSNQKAEYFPSLTLPLDPNFVYPFPQLPFISTIEKAVGEKLPDLASERAVEELDALFAKHQISKPANATLPRMLDTLAEKYIEPLCMHPTFITEHPEALSPLSKSYIDEETGQRVAYRAELFIEGREYVNMYEEENSPFEQRRKFMMQLDYQAEGAGVIDESYLEALEWGMPPTGGWGCGLDRLVMLFAGKKRIADVLPFGTLRNVVSISKNGQNGM